MSKGLEELKDLQRHHYGTLKEFDDKLSTIEKKLKALNEILVLHDKWLGNEMSDFEFFTQLNEIKNKYGLLKEASL